MAFGRGLSKGLDCRERFRCIRAPRVSWLNRLRTVLLTSLLFAGQPLRADEFDPLVVYGEAKPLNDRWQACAASFIEPRLQSRRSSETLATEALRSCRTEQDKLLRFLVGKIGRRSAENVIAALREKYQSGLIAAIDELRTRR